MKRLCVAMLLAVTLIAGTTMRANAVSLGTLNPGDFKQIGGDPGPGSFSDTFDFYVSSTLVGAAATINVKLDLLNNTFLDIEDFTLEFINLTTNQVLDSADGLDSLSVSYSPLLTGVQYAIRVSGDAVGTLGGAYGGALAVAAVPVPAALPLMLGALAGLGLIARRKTDA